MWPRGATELPVDTDDDGTHALRSLRAASGRRAVVSVLLIFVWAISMTPCFVYKGRTGLNADSSRSHFIVGLCVETGEFILTFVFVRAIRVIDGVFCIQTRSCRNFFWWTSRGAKRCSLPRKYPNTTQIQPEYLPRHRVNILADYY